MEVQRGDHSDQSAKGRPQSPKFTKVQRGTTVTKVQRGDLSDQSVKGGLQSPKCKGGTTVTKIHQSGKGGPQSPKFTKVN